jgi:hypothetical protein
MNFIIDRGKGERERLWISGLESKIFQSNLSAVRMLAFRYSSGHSGEAKNHEDAQEDCRVRCD